MRLSSYYKLVFNQSSLDFVDVDAVGDTPLYIDPSAIKDLETTWGDWCVSLIQNYFTEVLSKIQENDSESALALLSHLGEPNETHLGVSRRKARGRGLGPELSEKVYKALTKSEAVKTGLLKDLEDTALLIEGIDKDMVSDMVTNIIRFPLIEYTKDMAKEYNIPLTESVDSGPLWNSEKKEWFSKFENLPSLNNSKLLLVPKVIVRKTITYNQSEYYNQFILTALQEREIRANTSLVRLLKKGGFRVYKKDLKKKYGFGKQMMTKITLEEPEILEKYKQEKSSRPMQPLSNDEFLEYSASRPTNWDSLSAELKKIKPGKDDAYRYNNFIEKVFSSIFYPDLVYPKKEYPIHDGRKRLDITYTNYAQGNFFLWVSKHYPSANIVVECKNYSQDVDNAGLDQLSGRFSPSRGQIGFLVCREFEDKQRFIKKCKDTAKDQRGYVITLDDNDILQLLKFKRDSSNNLIFEFLKERFNELVD